jgi:hypothetical protein
MKCISVSISSANKDNGLSNGGTGDSHENNAPH